MFLFFIPLFLIILCFSYVQNNYDFKQANILGKQLIFSFNTDNYILTMNGPELWHSGQTPGCSSVCWDCTKGPKMNPHLLQSYLTTESCGRTPVVAVTTPIVLTSWLTWSFLKEIKKIDPTKLIWKHSVFSKIKQDLQ